MISGHIPPKTPKNAPFRRDFNAKRAIYQRINPTQHRANKAATRGDDHRRPAVPLRVSRPVPVWVADADDLNSITDHQRPTPADVIQRDTPPTVQDLNTGRQPQRLRNNRPFIGLSLYPVKV